MATDHQLVSWLRGRHPDSALAELLKRYGPMVRRAALRVTGDAHAAEDVSQAVFLVLVRKSGKLGRVRSLGGLLHRLATDAARDWLKAEARRRRREEEAAKMKAAREGERPAPLPAGFDAVLNRLPAAHREAVVARYLRGLSGAEAAAELGIKEGTLEARLARALAKLRRVLARSSPGLTVAALGASLSAEAAGARALTTTQVASITAAAFGGAKTTVAVMAEGMVKAMMWTKIKIAAAVVCAAMAVGGGGAITITRMAAGEPAAPGALRSIPANTWKLLAEDGGGKRFTRLVNADAFGRLYIWGVGGYELESFTPGEGKWRAALPESKKQAWSNAKAPLFEGFGRKYGWEKRPHYMPLGHYEVPNTVRFWDFEGVKRPSPAYVFNQACYDPVRKRVLFFVGGKTFALDPKNNTWTDLKPKRGPAACEALVWASICHDPVNDEFLLFGGGMALNLDGGARTWLFDPKANAWRRPEMKLEPPLRCNAPIVYDRKCQAMVLFGGDEQSARLNDTWVYRCKQRRWEERKPNPSPPPMSAPATAAVPGGGRVLVCDGKQTWVYETAANRWRPAGGALSPKPKGWGLRLTAAGAEKRGVVFLLAFAGKKRRTYAFRYDPAGPAPGHKGVPPGTKAYPYDSQRKALASAPKPDRATHERFLNTLPPNKWIDPKPPGAISHRTWSSATFDTHRGEVLYTGGGHCGYSGNDVAHYSVAENRWSISWDPAVPPYMAGCGGTVYGWAYAGRPWSQHTYRWYAYDPKSKTMVYSARSNPKCKEVLLSADSTRVLRHGKDIRGGWTFVYDPVKRSYYPPSFGRPFFRDWNLALCSTPHGVYATDDKGRLHHGLVERGRVTWKTIDRGGPRRKRGYHYEWSPLVYDSKRDRLLLLLGSKSVVEVHERPLKPGGKWGQLKTKGPVTIGREAVYLPKHDVALLLVPGGRLFALGMKTLVWRELAEKAPMTGSMGTAMMYDPLHDLCVMITPRRRTQAVYLMRFDARTAKYQ